MTKKIVTTRRWIKTYYYLFRTSEECLMHAESDDQGVFYDCLACMTFCAFSIEAYVNHYGDEIVENWSSIERNLRGVYKKIERVCKERELPPPDYSTSPFDQFQEIKDFRDFAAHGKSLDETIVERHTLQTGQSTPTGRTDWERKCVVENAARFVDNTRAIIESLHRAFGLNGSAFSRPMSSEYSAVTED